MNESSIFMQLFFNFEIYSNCDTILFFKTKSELIWFLAHCLKTDQIRLFFDTVLCNLPLIETFNKYECQFLTDKMTSYAYQHPDVGKVFIHFHYQTYGAPYTITPGVEKFEPFSNFAHNLHRYFYLKTLYRFMVFFNLGCYIGNFCFLSTMTYLSYIGF